VINLRPYQTNALDAVRAAYRSGKKAPILVAPTGSGKTVMASSVISGATSKGRSVLFLAHRFELVAQASMKLAHYGIRHKIVAPADSIRQIKIEHFRALGKSLVDDKALVAVGTVQTQSRRLADVIRHPDLIVIDECHLSIAPTYQKVIDQFPDAMLLGLTATPTRLDGKGLGDHAGGVYDELIVLCQPTTLLADGFLVPCRIFGTPNMPDLTGVKTVRGDYDPRQMAIAVNKPKLVGDIIDHYRDIAHGRPAIAFCASIAHADEVAAQFDAAGYRAVSVSGESDPAERAKAIAGLGTGEIDVVCNCALYIEGLDQTAISCVILATKTQSLTRFLQSIGRGLRPHPGKNDCIILDHGGSVYLHGHPFDDREWTLDGKVRRGQSTGDNEPSVSINTCPVCFTIHLPAPICPTCGHKYPERSRAMETEKGQLVELEQNKLAAKREAEIAKQRAKVQRKKEERQCETLEDLIELGKARGYNYPKTWAERVFGFRQKKAV
jgi:DNA repair protein RadD